MKVYLVQTPGSSTETVRAAILKSEHTLLECEGEGLLRTASADTNEEHLRLLDDADTFIVPGFLMSPRDFVDVGVALGADKPVVFCAAPVDGTQKWLRSYGNAVPCEIEEAIATLDAIEQTQQMLGGSSATADAARNGFAWSLSPAAATQNPLPQGSNVIGGLIFMVGFSTTTSDQRIPKEAFQSLLQSQQMGVIVGTKWDTILKQLVKQIDSALGREAREIQAPCLVEDQELVPESSNGDTALQEGPDGSDEHGGEAGPVRASQEGDDAPGL